MEIREGFRTVPSRPIALVLAALAVVALALTVWFVLGTGVRSTVNDRTFTPTVHAAPGTVLRQDSPSTGKPASDPYSPHDTL